MSEWHDTTTPYYELRRAESLDAAVRAFGEWSHDQLVAVIVNSALNDWIRDLDDAAGDALTNIFSHNGSGKPVPYVGWYWRNVDFVAGAIPIANCGSFIGVCESNKWGYPMRMLEADEAERVTALLWSAMCEEDTEKRTALIKNVWDTFQSFTIEDDPWT